MVTIGIGNNPVHTTPAPSSHVNTFTKIGLVPCWSRHAKPASGASRIEIPRLQVANPSGYSCCGKVQFTPVSRKACIAELVSREKGERNIRMHFGRSVGRLEYRLVITCDSALCDLPVQPAIWKNIEVPYILAASTPLPIRVWGIDLEDHPFHESLRYRRSDVWSKWCCAFTVFAQDVAAALMDRLLRAQLTFFLPLLRFGIDRIGWHHLVSTKLEADILSREVSSIRLVRWNWLSGTAQLGRR